MSDEKRTAYSTKLKWESGKVNHWKGRRSGSSGKTLCMYGAPELASNFYIRFLYRLENHHLLILAISAYRSDLATVKSTASHESTTKRNVKNLKTKISQGVS